MKIQFRESNTCKSALHIIHHGCTLLDDDLLCTSMDICAFGTHIAASTTKARYLPHNSNQSFPHFVGYMTPNECEFARGFLPSRFWVQRTCRLWEHGNCKCKTFASSHTLSTPMMSHMNTLDFWVNIIDESTISSIGIKATMPNKHCTITKYVHECLQNHYLLRKVPPHKET